MRIFATRTVVFAAAVTLLTGVSSLSLAQAPGTTEGQMRGDMGDHPHQATQPGSKRPMSKDKADPQMKGEMGDHPHQTAQPGSNRPMSKDKADPQMKGEMGDHPHTGSTSSRK